ncbi:MAG: putative bifunctional diguanylate cyclase/phosphodiesterase [Phycisphaerales bacterium JB063]
MLTLNPAAQARFEQDFRDNACRADKMFAWLMVVQFIAGVAGALWIAPRTWAGSSSWVHVHVWASIGIGAAITAGPLLMIWARRGETVTRYVVAVAQMLFSILLIHISGGRIEAHFHIFGSLAFLAFYRDWRVFIPATVVIAADHLFRGLYWPESVFGVLSASPWRAAEHAGWVIFEDIFLIFSCLQSRKEMQLIAQTQVNLEQTNQAIELKVEQRTEELQVSNEALRTSDERYRLVVEGTREAVWDWDLDSSKVYYAPNWRPLLGLAEDAPMSDSIDEWFGRITSSNLQSFQGKLDRYLKGEITEFDIEVEMRHEDGTSRWMLCRAAASRDDEGQATRLTGSLTDISELKQAQNKLRRMAEFDNLTDLPNREYLQQRLQVAMSERRGGLTSAVAFFDFDRFKVINDSLGHNAGDALLKSIADRFRAYLRPRDTVARFGGDEFVVLLRDVTGEAQVHEICDRLLKLFAEPHHIDGHAIVSTASIGVVINSDRYETPDDLIRDADAAMYRAKSSGRDGYKMFDAAMHDEAVKRLNLENEFRRAMDERQIEVYYQPIITTAEGDISGFEALARWNHPERGVISPDEFIPLAEETGLIVELGEWVFHQACNQLRVWRMGLPSGHDLSVTVNLSKRQLIHPHLISVFGRILHETGVPADRVWLEITESAIMDERNDASKIIEQLKALGVKLALDDFGTGHSSLSCLHQFPIDVLKVDRSFVRHLNESMAFSAVLSSIISLGHNLNMRIIGEGIESSAQLAQLQALDCDYAQGYFFAKPMPAEAASQMLATTPHWRNAA